MTPTTPSDRLAALERALEMAWLDLEAAYDLHGCASCNRAAGEAAAALSAYREGKGTEDHLADVATDRAPVSVNDTPRGFRSHVLKTPVAKLVDRVRAQIETGHCGESTNDIIWRQRRNAEWEEIAALLTHPQPWRPGREAVAREVQQCLLKRKTWEATADSILALLPASPVGWRPIESAPKCEDVLLYCPYLAASNPERMELGWAKGENWHHTWATHWQALPASPVPSTEEEP